MATTITKSIGTTGRDYSNATTWEADIPANLITADEVWLGEVYNDSEITSTATTTISGHTTDATRFIELRPATGEGFKDGIGSSALRYDSSYGACFRNTSGTNQVFQVDDDFVFLRQLQIRHETDLAVVIEADNCEANRCIMEGSIGAAYSGTITVDGASDIINCLAVSIASGDYAGIEVGFVSSGGANIVGCTSLHPSDVANSDRNIAEYAGSNVVKGCAGFGSDQAFIEDGGWGAGSDYNASDDISGPGANTLDSLTYADQFENTTGASMDARLKTGSDLLAASIQFAETNDEDILGNPRDTSNPSIGCWEIPPSGASLLLMQQSFRQ